VSISSVALSVVDSANGIAEGTGIQTKGRIVPFLFEAAFQC